MGIASAGALQYAQQGLFAKAFCDAVRRPTIGASQELVSLDTIVQAVNDAHPGAEQQALLFTPAGGYGSIAPFFANPAHRPGVAGLTITEQHWLSRVRGGPAESTTGFYLTGRTGRVRAAQQLAAWMTGPDPSGLAIVTGSPGTGKSALLALPVLLTQPALRADLLRGAEPGSLVQRMADLLPRIRRSSRCTHGVSTPTRPPVLSRRRSAVLPAPPPRYCRTWTLLPNKRTGWWPWTPSMRRPRRTRC